MSIRPEGALTEHAGNLQGKMKAFPIKAERAGLEPMGLPSVYAYIHELEVNTCMGVRNKDTESDNRPI